MTEKEFKAHIQTGLWHEKYYYYFLSILAITGGFYFFYRAIKVSNESDPLFNRILFILACIFLLLAGTTFINLIHKRYSVKEFVCNLPKGEKENIIREIAAEFNIRPVERSKEFWFFTYKYGWWSNGYTCYLGISEKGIMVSFLGRTGGRGGFVDLGQTNRLRKKVHYLLYKKINYTP